MALSLPDADEGYEVPALLSLDGAPSDAAPDPAAKLVLPCLGSDSDC